jgi:hypothetical protein
MLAASRRSRTSTPPDSPVHAGFKVQIFGEYMELPVATTVVRTALARCRYPLDDPYSLGVVPRAGQPTGCILRTGLVVSKCQGLESDLLCTMW